MPDLTSSFGMDNDRLPLLLLAFLPSQPASFVFCVSLASLNCHHAKEKMSASLFHFQISGWLLEITLGSHLSVISTLQIGCWLFLLAGLLQLST